MAARMAGLGPGGIRSEAVEAQAGSRASRAPGNIKVKSWPAELGKGCPTSAGGGAARRLRPALYTLRRSPGMVGLTHLCGLVSAK
jgi:hypothetical protein